MSTDNNNGGKPAFVVYRVVEREGKDPWWHQLGVAFWHNGQSGLSIVLQSLPLPGPDGECRMVLRPPKDKEENQDPPAESGNNVRRFGNRRSTRK